MVSPDIPDAVVTVNEVSGFIAITKPGVWELCSNRRRFSASDEE
jgi:hypothetical protein